MVRQLTSRWVIVANLLLVRTSRRLTVSQLPALDHKVGQ